jgi:hypothetical protein
VLIDVLLVRNADALRRSRPRRVDVLKQLARATNVSVDTQVDTERPPRGGAARTMPGSGQGEIVVVT